MDNLGFLAAAYALTFGVLAGYTWSLRRRWRRARAAWAVGAGPGRREDHPERTEGRDAR